VFGRSWVVGRERVEEALLVGDACFDRLVNECLASRVVLASRDGGTGPAGPTFLIV
jgi:hypothetical protein